MIMPCLYNSYSIIIQYLSNSLNYLIYLNLMITYFIRLINYIYIYPLTYLWDIPTNLFMGYIP